MRKLSINPPLLNSANPWCTTLSQLQSLYDSPYTGAVTTRTSLLEGFPHDDNTHQYTFYNPTTHNSACPNPTKSGRADETGSLNTLGYSPLPLSEYLGFVKTISDGISKLPTTGGEAEHRKGLKPVIISVTGSVDEVVEAYKQISALQTQVRMVLAMEVNLSCPNIPGKPPPAYDSTALLTYLTALKGEVGAQYKKVEPSTLGVYAERVHVPIGIKTPPYTYDGQYRGLIDALVASAEVEPKDIPCPISFITATNTLGSSLLLTPTIETHTSPPTSPISPTSPKSREVWHHTLNSATGQGIGGLAGAPLHPLALGNVYTIKGMLFQYRELEHVQIIGVGGVEDIDGYRRMRAVGASAVGIGTALGRKGVKIFEEIGDARKKGEH